MDREDECAHLMRVARALTHPHTLDWKPSLSRRLSLTVTFLSQEDGRFGPETCRNSYIPAFALVHTHTYNNHTRRRRRSVFSAQSIYHKPRPGGGEGSIGQKSPSHRFHLNDFKCFARRQLRLRNQRTGLFKQEVYYILFCVHKMFGYQITSEFYIAGEGTC